MYKTKDYEILRASEKLNKFYCDTVYYYVNNHDRPDEMWYERAYLLLRSVYNCHKLPESLDIEVLIEHAKQYHDVDLKEYFYKIVGLDINNPNESITDIMYKNHCLLLAVLGACVEKTELELPSEITVNNIDKNRIEIQLNDIKLYVDKIDSDNYILSNDEKATPCNSLSKLYFILNNFVLFHELNDNCINSLHLIVNDKKLI